MSEESDCINLDSHETSFPVQSYSITEGVEVQADKPSVRMIKILLVITILNPIQEMCRIRFSGTNY